VIPQQLAIFNGKGGVGKTSLSANVAAMAAASGWRVLMIDLDSQGNLGRDLGYLWRGETDHGQSLVDAIQYGKPLAPPLKDVRPGLDVIPAGHLTDDLGAVMAERIRKDGDAIFALEKALAPLASNYSLVVCDCPPKDALIHDLALASSHYLVIPTTWDAGSLDGLARVADRVSQVGRFNPDLAVLAVVLFGFAASAKAMLAEVRKEIAKDLGEDIPVLLPPVRSADRAAKDMRDSGQVAYEYEQVALDAPPWYKGGGKALSKAASSLAGDYQAITQQLLELYREDSVPAVAQ